MASRSAKLRLHILGSKVHKWLALLIGVQVLLWMATGALMSFLDIERVRSEHVISRAPGVLADDAAIPSWLEGEDGVVSLTTRALIGQTVVEVRRLNGDTSLHDPRSGRPLSPLSAATARFIALGAWKGPKTSIKGARLIETAIGTEYRGPFPAWQVTYADGDGTRVYIDASNGAVLAARSDTWRLFDFIWGLHIMDWTQRDRINSWWLLVFGIGGTVIALSGFVLLANRFPRIRMRRSPRESK
ncbi:MAG: PepSY domain-containing protein [Pacificimonas sp.]